MNATSQPQPAATAELSLTRAAKEKLLLQMYRLAHWIELIRFFGYQTLPMEKARQGIKPIAEKYGKEPVSAAIWPPLARSWHKRRSYSCLLCSLP